MNYKNIKIIFKINLKDHIKSHHIKNQLEKENTVITTSLKKVKKVILMLQKFSGDQKGSKKEYEDEIDGLPEYETNSPTDKDQEEGDQEIQTKRKEPKRQVEKPKKVKKGITKSIKM